MKLSEQLIAAIDDLGQEKFHSGLLHACIAIDTVSKKLYPSEKLVGRRYVQCLRQYYWLLEPMIGGINLISTLFEHVPLKNSPPDLAAFIYEIFRCNLAHGDEIPPDFTVYKTNPTEPSTWEIGVGVLHIPDRVVWGLIAIAVFSKVNKDQENLPGYYWLTLGGNRFMINDWWGRERDIRHVAKRHNTTRVTLKNMVNLKPPMN